MKIKIRSVKLYKKEILFIVAYICFFCSLFLGDTSIETNGIQIVAKILRYISYLLSFFQLLMHKAKPKQMMIELAIWAISMTYFMWAKDIYLPMLIMLIVGSRDSSERNICTISLTILVAGTILVLMGNMIGIIPEIMTSKAFSRELTRHSYGFYHSNVLPNNLLMIEILTVWKYREKISRSIIILFLMLHICVYFLSASRMSLIVGLFLTFGVLILKARFNQEEKILWLKKIACYMAPLYSVLSILLMLLVNTNRIVQKIDLVFSNRFWAAFLKMSNVGIKLFNFNTNLTFYQDGLVIDNGYLFLLMRYGLVALLMINVVSIALKKQFESQPYCLMCLVCVFTIAFIDNLFLNYRFLPFLMFAFLHGRFKKKIKAN